MKLFRITSPFHRCRFALLALLLLVCAGCGNNRPGDYVPSPATSRESLIAMLDAWKRGEPPGRIEGKPAIQVGDTFRQPGQTLESYELLGELPSNDGRQFTVRAKLANPDSDEKINFVVVGIDPIWIFRLEDYEMVTHWDHKMPSSGTEQESKNLSPK